MDTALSSAVTSKSFQFSRFLFCPITDVSNSRSVEENVSDSKGAEFVEEKDVSRFVGEGNVSGFVEEEDVSDSGVDDAELTEGEVDEGEVRNSFSINERRVRHTWL
jgi:hypothetical protein